MRILLTGRGGQLGHELERTLAPLGEVRATTTQELNLADADAICRVVREYRPDMIVNAAAYTAVDRAESEPDRATAVNAIAPAILSEEARKLGAAIVHYSTDYVFDGSKEGWYTEEDATNPLNVYGRTKLEGEQAIAASGVPHLTFRTSWVYGARGSNFLRTILRLARERPELKIVDDQVGAPNWSRWLAEATAVVCTHATRIARDPRELPSGAQGLFHLSSAGATSWFGFAQEILRRVAPEGDRSWARLIAIPTTGYPTPARRPANSRLSSTRLEREFGVKLPDWQTGLALCLADLRETA